MASGADPPDAVDKDNPTSAQADSLVLARTRIDAARDLPCAVSYTHLTLPTILLV